MTKFYSKCKAKADASEKSKPAKPKCDPIFLGKDVGTVNVFEYHDSDHKCHLSMSQLAKVCAKHYAECMSFLKSKNKKPPPPPPQKKDKKPVCEKVFLGP